MNRHGSRLRSTIKCVGDAAEQLFRRLDHAPFVILYEVTTLEHLYGIL